MLKTPIGRLRAIGVVEGVSYLVLLLISMPMKYIMGIPEPVQVVGMIHGVLFILYILAVIQAGLTTRWSLKWWIGALASSSIPVATFILDGRLQRTFEK
ncbi:MAG TPA: DUF3817 domain-containing protein [Bacilli bacterium]|nr:DUF3817 domain-containing protein [Bacilli bacterium]